MKDAERLELAETLRGMASKANMIARLYEDAADTVAGFRSEAEYQGEARDAFEAEQEQVDRFAWEPV